MEKLAHLDNGWPYLTIMMMISLFRVMMIRCCGHLKSSSYGQPFQIIYHYDKNLIAFTLRFAIQCYDPKG